MSVSAARARLVSKAAWDPSTGRGKTKRRGGGETGSPNNLSLGQYRLLGIPQTQRQTLAWASDFGLGPTGGTYSETTYTINSAYRPDAATSAAGFAKYMALYSKCFVLRSKWRLKLRRATTAAGASAGVAVCVTTNSTALASFQAAIENGLCQWDVMASHPDRITLTGSVNHAKFLNKPRYLDDPQLFCAAATQPGQVIVLHVGILEAAGGCSFWATLELALDCVFTDPIPFT